MRMRESRFVGAPPIIAAACAALFCASHAAASDIGAVDTFLGIKIGAPISESVSACADLEADNKTTTCYEDNGKSSYSIKRRPFLGFRYLTTAYADDSGAITEIYLETLIENAPFLKHLLTVRYGGEPTRLVEYIYSKSATNESREVESSVWLGLNIAIVFSAPDPFNAKDASVSISQRAAFDQAVARHEKAVAEMAGQL